MMRYELNFDEDKIIDIEAIGDDGVLDLNDCCRIMNEQQKTIKKQDIEIQSLNLHIEKLVDGDEISKLLMREYERSDGLEKENEQLKIANAKWLDKSLQDKQIRYNNTNHKELTKKYLQLKEENEQLKQEVFVYKKAFQQQVQRCTL